MRLATCIFSLVMLFGPCGPNALSRAQENLLGLPTPLNPKSVGSVMLHGGGPVSDEAFDRFVELAGGSQARIVLVPSAGYRVADFDTEDEFLDAVSRRYGSWVALPRTGRARSFQFLYTDDPDDADDEDFVAPLESATGVWFSGGLQARLNYRYVGEFPEQSRFQIALRKVLARGGIVGGTSAGMAALPEVMILADYYESSSGPASSLAAHGFGLFDRAIVDQHFDARGGRLERFTNLLRDSARLDRLAGRARAGERMMGIGVEERTALVVSGNRLEVLGVGVVHMFLKSHGGRTLTWHELAPGDTAQLRRDVPSVILVREELTLKR